MKQVLLDSTFHKLSIYGGCTVIMFRKSSFEMDLCGVTPSYGLNIYETDEAQDTSVSSMIIFAAVQVDRVMNQISRLWKFTNR